MPNNDDVLPVYAVKDLVLVTFQRQIDQH